MVREKNENVTDRSRTARRRPCCGCVSRCGHPVRIIPPTWQVPYNDYCQF